MTNENTVIQKDMRGAWRAETTIDLPELGPDKQMQLSVTTMKVSSGALVSRASVFTIDGDFRSHTVFSDYSAQLMSSTVRVTEKAVCDQHADAMRQFETVKQAVISFYAAKAAEAA